MENFYGYTKNFITGPEGTSGLSNIKILQRKFKNITTATYSKLTEESAKEILKEKYDLIIFDELHRTGAAEWNKFTNFIEVDFTCVAESSNEAKPNIFISGGALVVSGVSEPIQVTVYNLKGAVVLTQTITAEDSFDMSNLPKGVYVVKANNEVVKVVL